MSGRSWFSRLCKCSYLQTSAASYNGRIGGATADSKIEKKELCFAKKKDETKGWMNRGAVEMQHAACKSERNKRKMQEDQGQVWPVALMNPGREPDW